MFPNEILVMNGSAVPPPLEASPVGWRMARARRTEPRQVSRRYENMHYKNIPGKTREEVRAGTAAAGTPTLPRAEEGRPSPPPLMLRSRLISLPLRPSWRHPVA